MCVCTPTIRTPWCGRSEGCQPPKPWNVGLHPMLHTPTPGRTSPARDVATKLDPATADVERLAKFLAERAGKLRARYSAPDPKERWEKMLDHERGRFRHLARAMVRDIDELEEILAELMVKGGRF